MARVGLLFEVAMAGLCLLAAVLQYNDPDPLGWIAVYTVTGVLTIGLRRWPDWWPAAVLLAVVALVWSVAIGPAVLGSVPSEAILRQDGMDVTGAEEAREVLGLWLVAVWSAIVAVLARRRFASARRGSD